MRILTVPLCVTLIIPPFAVSTIELNGVSVPLKSSLDGVMWAVAPLSINQSVTDVTNALRSCVGGLGGSVGVGWFSSCECTAVRHSALVALCLTAFARFGLLLVMEYSVKSHVAGAIAASVLRDATLPWLC
jgi:hypothetical protein